MKVSNIPITSSLESIERINQRIEEAAYHTWLDRSRHFHPGDAMSDWLEAEREAQRGFPDVPSAP